jgi:hypothetical protein
MLLVDAFNVIRAQWVLPAERRGMDVRGLITLIGRSRYAKRRLRIVVDGRPGPDWIRHGVFDTLAGHAWSRVGHAEIVFSGREREADDVIEDVLARSRGIAITVVSSDRRLIRAAGRAGADQIGNGSFLRQLNEDLDRERGERVPAFAAEVPLDRYAVAHWMREFGYEPPHEPPPIAPVPVPKKTTPKRTASKTPAPPAPGFGSRLDVPAASTPHPAPAPTPGPPPALPGEAEALDPLLRDAFEEWYGSLHRGDLDMRKWVDGVEPM